MIFTRVQAKKSLKRLYYHRKDKKIYIEAFTGFYKSKTFGPYNPNIG